MKRATGKEGWAVLGGKSRGEMKNMVDRRVNITIHLMITLSV
jgi:hypothetical protein